MFENYKGLSAEERAQVKTLHKAIRADLSAGDRYRNLAWGFIRGFKYRRIERTHRTQPLAADVYFPHTPTLGFVETAEGRFFEHNLPDALRLTKLLAKHLPEFAEDLANEWQLKPGARIVAWLSDRSGAIPVPARKAKEAA